MTINETIQAFNADAIIELFTLDVTPIGGAVYRFTSNTDGGDAIYHDGNLYAPVPLEAEGFEQTSQGAYPTPKIRISNANPVINAAVNEYGGLEGAILTRLKTFAKFLDDGDTPDPSAHFGMDVYTVERKSSQNKVYIEWELSASIDQQGRHLPNRSILRNTCTHRYRYYDGGDFDYTDVSCPYTGTSYFNENGVPVTNPADDECGRRNSDCRLRFGESGILPTRAFPGVGRAL